MTTGPDFFAVEITAYKPGVGTFTYGQGHGTRVHGGLSEFEDQIQSTTVLTASDLGYRTRTTDPGGVVAYPPIVTGAFQVSRQMNLDPTQSQVGAAWGSVTLSNADGRFNSIASDWNSDNRPVRILHGVKGYDDARNYLTDPAYATLVPAFTGVGTPWFLSDTELSIPLRDATYFAEMPLQSNIYGGTGGYDGTVDMQGKPKPKARGGTTVAPIHNITPVLIDPAFLIYQYCDAPGTVVNAYEGGAAVWSYAGDVADLYVGAPAPGTYRTSNARGMFQLGSSPQRTVTADVTGAFPIAGAISQAALIARYLLTEDLAVPVANVNTASFVLSVPTLTVSEAHGARPRGTLSELTSAYTQPDPATGIAGVWWGSDATIDGPTALNAVVSSFGGQIVSNRAGQLTLFLLRALPATATPVAQLDQTNVVNLIPQALPDTVQPPTYRVRVNYAMNYTVMASGVSPSATPAQLQYVGNVGPNAPFLSQPTQQAWLRPNDLGPLSSALQQLTDAQAVANNLGNLWSVRRRLYQAAMPTAQALARELGDVVNVVWPADNLAGGKLGQIVGESWRSGDPTITLLVLV